MAHTATIDLTQIVEVQPMPGAELRARYEYVNGERTDVPILRDGKPVFRMAALAVLPMLGYQAVTIETTTTPDELRFEASPSTRLALTGQGELSIRGGDFGAVHVTIIAPSVSVVTTSRRGSGE